MHLIIRRLGHPLEIQNEAGGKQESHKPRGSLITGPASKHFLTFQALGLLKIGAICRMETVVIGPNPERLSIF